MKYLDVYNQWLNSNFIDDVIKEELMAIKDNEAEIKDRFYSDLIFGTAGLRGKIGAGTNRMNKYIVAKATQGLANTIINHGQQAVDRGVVIAYDVRIMSKEFSEIAAGVLALNGIKTYLFDDIRPTPLLSFALRKLNAISGIVVTASHNPKDYNGYKVYWEEGSQILDDIADEILHEIEKINIEELKYLTIEEGINKGLIEYLEKDMDELFYKETLSLSINEDIDKDINVVYTPLNGTGNIPVREVLKRRGFCNINIVKEQELPDGTFKTVGYPNPEDVKAFKYAEELAKKIDADIIIATDPDCDRVAMMAKDKNGKYYAFNGNQTGALLIYYIISSLSEKNMLNSKSSIVKSIVTGNLGAAIAKEYGVNVFETLTGFKNICALPNLWDKTKEYEFIFGYEESIGYVYGDHLRDKDAVGASLMIVEMAAYYKKRGLNLVEVLEEIYEKFGYYKESLISLVLEGIEGQNRISRMMDEIRKNPFTEIGDLKVEEITDFQNGYNEIGKSNVLKITLDDESWFSIRPSGTEPKIKLYIYVKDKLEEKSNEKIKLIEKIVLDRLNSIE